MTLYLLNSIIIPIKDHHALFEIREIDAKEAREIIQTRPAFESAIGHDVTAQALSLLLGTNVPVSRKQVQFSVGDEAIAFTLSKRLAEGQIVRTMEELESIGYKLYYIRRITPDCFTLLKINGYNLRAYSMHTILTLAEKETDDLEECKALLEELEEEYG